MIDREYRAAVNDERVAVVTRDLRERQKIVHGKTPERDDELRIDRRDLRVRYGLYASISTGNGSRFSGGRRLTMFVMYTSARFQPSPSIILSSSWPPRRRTGGVSVLVDPGRLTDEHYLAIDITSPKTRFAVSRSGSDAFAAISTSIFFSSACLPIRIL